MGEESKRNRQRGGVVVGLLPARTDTKWWSDVMTASELRFIKGRIMFEGADACAPFPSVIAIWGTPRTPIIKMVDNAVLKSQYNTRQKGTGIGTTPLVQNSGISTGGLSLD